MGTKSTNHHAPRFRLLISLSVGPSEGGLVLPLLRASREAPTPHGTHAGKGGQRARRTGVCVSEQEQQPRADTHTHTTSVRTVVCYSHHHRPRRRRGIDTQIDPSSSLSSPAAVALARFGLTGSRSHLSSSVHPKGHTRLHPSARAGAYPLIAHSSTRPREALGSPTSHLSCRSDAG